MVTYTKTMVKDRLALFSYTGLSTDTKPDQTEGDIFIGNGSTSRTVKSVKIVSGTAVSIAIEDAEP